MYLSRLKIPLGKCTIIGDDVSIKSSNVKININDVCNLISVSLLHYTIVKEQDWKRREKQPQETSKNSLGRITLVTKIRMTLITSGMSAPNGLATSDPICCTWKLGESKIWHICNPFLDFHRKWEAVKWWLTLPNVAKKHYSCNRSRIS